MLPKEKKLDVNFFLSKYELTGASISFNREYSEKYMFNILNICYNLNTKSDIISLVHDYFYNNLQIDDILEDLYKNTENLELNMDDQVVLQSSLIKRFQERVYGYLNINCLSKETIDYLNKFKDIKINTINIIAILKYLNANTTVKIRKEIEKHVETVLAYLLKWNYPNVSMDVRNNAILEFEAKCVKIKNEKISDRAISVYMLYFMKLLDKVNLKMFRIPQSPNCILKILKKLDL